MVLQVLFRMSSLTDHGCGLAGLRLWTRGGYAIRMHDQGDTTMVRNLNSSRVASTAAVALALSVAGTASAHSRHEATIPGDGTVVETAPEVIVLSFDTPTRITMIELSNSRGEAFALERSDGMAPVTRFEATPAQLSAGSYTVQWRGLSADGHPTSCRFSFDVQR